ncbi:MAG: DsrE family protein [Geothrix sp.]|nr:DsrE family protein [Geothrix sp.]
MKLGIIIYSTDAETVWNAFRLGVFALKAGDTVNVFLLASGVECESLDTEWFSVTGQMQDLVDRGGKILACGTCLKLRNSEGTELCPLSTMKDLYELVRDSDRVVSF